MTAYYVKQGEGTFICQPSKIPWVLLEVTFCPLHLHVKVIASVPQTVMLLETAACKNLFLCTGMCIYLFSGGCSWKPGLHNRSE